MRKLSQTIGLAALAAATSTVWAQATPDLYDSTGKAVGQYKGDSVIIPYNNAQVRLYLEAHWDYAATKPTSSGLNWKHVPLYYQTADCSGQAYIGTAPTAPTPSGQAPAAPATGPAYSPPAYGTPYLVATTQQGGQWTGHVSAENPTYTQYAIQSERQYDGSCAAKSYSNLWVTPVQTTVPLQNYGAPPFYVR